jgi:cytochrome c biogenesis protein CcdA/thiol-disulfide isomerase/thioredoxin
MNPIPLLLAFLEGLSLIISPCILPILPIVLSASVSGSKLRPIGLIVGFTLSFTVFTLFSRQLVLSFGLDTNLLRQLSFLFLLLVGITLLIPQLGDLFAKATSGLANLGNKLTQKAQSPQEFVTGLLIGAGIGLVWVPCSGPILAAVIVQSVTQTTNTGAVLTVLLFALGAALPMVFIALGGKAIMSKFNLFKTHGETIRRILGAVIIASVLFSAQGALMSLFHLEQSPQAEAATATAAISKAPALKLEGGLAKPYAAPKIAGISQWLNGQPELKGKVVLVDFWTYSCINCLRTLPHMTAWHKKYAEQGLVIVGVHAPEFEFEKSAANVKQAIVKHGIAYPVALDNDFRTWRNFNNQYWPAHYLINRDGNVVYTHFGEGEYDKTENNIRYLLGLKSKVAAQASDVAGGSFFQSPETYLGYKRASNFASPEGLKPDETTLYSTPAKLDLHHWALKGKWQLKAQFAEAQAAKSALSYNFFAKKVYLVLGSKTGQPVQVDLLLNGKPIGALGGQSLTNSHLTVRQHTLYELVNLPKAESGVLELISQNAGLQAYAFTFGG